MAIPRSLSLAAVLAFTLAACAQTPTGPAGPDHAAHHPPGSNAAAAPGERMAMMDAHMGKMREMHDRMARAATPQDRQALMAEHMKLMQDGMAMMGGMGPGGMGGMGGMGAMGMGGMGMGGMQGMGPAGAAGAPMDMATRHQMMEKRMEMMQSMMQMMMDRMGPPAARP